MNPQIFKYFAQCASRHRDSYLGQLLHSNEKKAFEAILPTDLRGFSVLDVGAGRGEYARFVLSRGAAQVKAVDGVLECLQQIRDPRIETARIDLNEFEETGVFDLVICLGVLEFIDQPKQLLEKVCKAVKHNGYLIVLYPPRHLYSWPYLFFHWINRNSIHLFSGSDILNWAEKSGMRKIEFKKAHAFAPLY